MKPFFLTAFSIFCLSLYAQNDMPNRKAYTFEIAADQTHQYGMEVKESPYFVKEKIIQLYCNEKVFVECEIKSDSISTMKVVAKNNNPEKTIVIEFTQNAEDRKNITTYLRVKNPFNKELKYDAMMYTPLSQEWKKTSIVPISPNLENFEMWSHAIITLVLENWHLK